MSTTSIHDKQRVTVTWRDEGTNNHGTRGWVCEDDDRWYVYQRGDDKKGLWRVSFCGVPLRRSDGKSIAWWRTRQNAMHYADLHILQHECPFCGGVKGHSEKCDVPELTALVKGDLDAESK